MAVLAPHQHQSYAGQTHSVQDFALQAKAIAKRFGDKQVLQGLSLSLEAASFTAIVGRSGCGKSTFLRLLAGLDTPDNGDFLFGTVQRNRRAGDVRVMFQEPRLLPWLSIVDNVALGFGEEADKPASKAAALATLDAVGLAARAQEWPSVLSGGQKQRVALARALVSEPAILALDEPLGALDALTRLEMQSLLEEVWRTKGFTALMVTHDVGEAVFLADRVVVLEDGNITQDVVIDLPRPRDRGCPKFVAYERAILARLLNEVA